MYFLDLSVKIINGWSDQLEIWHAENLDPVLKKARKQQFYPGWGRLERKGILSTFIIENTSGNTK